MERTISKPLSGAEVRRAVLFKIEEMLEMDSRVANHLSFPAFSADITISLRLVNAVRAELDRELHLVMGDIMPGQGAEVDTTLSIPQMPPNEIRIDTDQPITVIADNGKGKVIEREVRYKRKYTKRAMEESV